MSIETLTLDLHHEILDRAEALRPLSSTVVRLASAVADPDSDVDDLVAILRGDPSLAASILREANSAMSGASSAIGTIESAVTRLGSGRVLALATSGALEIGNSDELPSYAMTVDDLREHAVYSSYVAEAIQNLVRDRVGPEVITSAFLHDLGKALLDNHLDPRYFSTIQVMQNDIIEAERELAHVDHAELGALLMELWSVPQPIADAIRYHHAPHEQLDAGAAVVAISDHVSKTLRGRPSETSPEALAWSLEALGLTLDQVIDRSERFLQRAGLRD